MRVEGKWLNLGQENLGNTLSAKKNTGKWIQSLKSIKTDA